MIESTGKLTDLFGSNLASLLAGKIEPVLENFDSGGFIAGIKKGTADKTLTQRVELIADRLKYALPDDYKKAIAILIKIMGDENKKETGMFKEYYWLMPVGKYIEKYGLDHPEISFNAIGELTRRNTGEYAIRPFVRKYPKKTLLQMKAWAKSENFHLRRLASEGLRPKLPWASKLDLFVENPEPVFRILDLLKKEQVKFVKKSVANNLTDYIKLNPKAAYTFIEKWKQSDNEHTQWMVNYATRKMTPG